MHIVINIPEEVVDNHDWSNYFGCMSPTLATTLLNGKVLPKGHGRLIDAKEFEAYIRDGFRDLKGLFKTEEYRRLAEQLTMSFLVDIQEQKTAVPEEWRADDGETS